MKKVESYSLVTLMAGLSNLVDHVKLDDIQTSFQPQLIGDYRQRNNRDKESNNIGKQLLEFCKTFSL